MKFSLRDHNLHRAPFLVELDGVKLRRVIAFDTDTKTVERLVSVGDGDYLIVYDPALHGPGLTSYGGMLTEILHGQVTIWGRIESQADLDAQTGRWA